MLNAELEHRGWFHRYSGGISLCWIRGVILWKSCHRAESKLAFLYYHISPSEHALMITRFSSTKLLVHTSWNSRRSIWSTIILCFQASEFIHIQKLVGIGILLIWDWTSGQPTWSFICFLHLPELILWCRQETQLPIWHPQCQLTSIMPCGFSHQNKIL